MDPMENELTSIISLKKPNVASSPAGLLDEYLASLDESDRSVIHEVIASDGDRAMVLINRGENMGSRFLITDKGATIGRAVESAIFLDDVTVSRVHAVIEKSKDSFQLRDCGSLNGTYVNSGTVATVVLHSGDEIQIGKFHLLFVCGKKKVEKH